MIVTLLYLTKADIKALHITDNYSVHRIVYSLFDDVRSEIQKSTSESSGFLYVDKGEDENGRKILILSNRSPKKINYGQVDSKPIPDSLLTHDHYGFEITLNPTKRDGLSGKTVAIRGRQAIAQWFIDKTALTCGFAVKPETLQIQNMDVKTADKKGHKVTQGSATLIGEFVVTDRNKFIQSFQKGIGRGRGFGFGLLQIIPLLSNKS